MEANIIMLLLVMSMLAIHSNCFQPQKYFQRKKRMCMLAMQASPSRSSGLTNVIIMPDNRVGNPSNLWHKWLARKLEEKGLVVGVYGMPNPYEFNTKRYEVRWLEYLRTDLGLATMEGQHNTLVVAHGFAADAILRYLENHRLAAALFVGPHDMYHAGERHGRDFVWPLIVKNVNTLKTGLMYGAEDKFITKQEGRRVKSKLRILNHLYKEVPSEKNFFDCSTLPDALTICEQLLTPDLEDAYYY